MLHTSMAINHGKMVQTACNGGNQVIKGGLCQDWLKVSLDKDSDYSVFSIIDLTIKHYTVQKKVRNLYNF